LSGTLTYDVKIVSTSITADSPTASWTFDIRSCARENDDPWVSVADPTESVDIDIIYPPASTELKRYTLLGNSIPICGTPEFSLKDSSGGNIDFLTVALVEGDIVVSIDMVTVVLGIYNVELEFSQPGV
jgi:hypothetical protein